MLGRKMQLLERGRYPIAWGSPEARPIVTPAHMRAFDRSRCNAASSLAACTTAWSTCRRLRALRCRTLCEPSRPIPRIAGRLHAQCARATGSFSSAYKSALTTPRWERRWGAPHGAAPAPPTGRDGPARACERTSASNRPGRDPRGGRCPRCGRAKATRCAKTICFALLEHEALTARTYTRLPSWHDPAASTREARWRRRVQGLSPDRVAVGST